MKKYTPLDAYLKEEEQRDASLLERTVTNDEWRIASRYKKKGAWGTAQTLSVITIVAFIVTLFVITA